MTGKSETTKNKVWGDDFTALRESLRAWENCDPHDDLTDVPPSLVHHMSRLAYYAKEYLLRHGEGR
jgi:hypothetical protein